jgi:hypothetical protein
VLLLGTKEAWTPLSWQVMEGIPDFLRGRGWVAVGSLHSTESQLCSLDEYMKSFLKRATAGWVAVVLEKAGVLTMDRSRPARGQVLFRLVDRAPLRETQVVGRPQSRTARGIESVFGAVEGWVA